nr:RNA-directed DNA polymerase, eukaryota [Tanacetum cinerariifolium]
IKELLAADHKRQVQLTKALRLRKGLQTQMIEFQRHHGPAKGPTQPDAPGEAVSLDNNRLIRLKKKLQLLKQEIHSWIKKEKSRSSMAIAHTQNGLTDIDRILNHGRVNMEILNQRTELMKSLNDIIYLETVEAAQKAKLSIRGVLIDGEWINDPVEVKHAFFSYFATRFEKSDQYRAHLDIHFPNILSMDQVKELEKGRYWKMMDIDILEAIKCFFDSGSFPRGFLVNESPSSEFQIFKGLKQGDPLSPFLFILVMESLHISFSRVMQAGMFTSVSIGELLKLSHFFADGAVFVEDWNDSNLSTIVYVLKCFFLASALKINVSKSKLMGIGVDNGVVERATNVVGCSTLSTPFIYLGVKVGDCMSRTQPWDVVIRKISARLSCWKVKTLSIGGRLTLLKSVLGSIPLYYLSLFKVSKGVIKKLESIRINFFNSSEGSTRKMGWNSWDKVLVLKLNGGLAGSLKCSRSNMHRKSLWMDIIKEVDILKRKETCKHVSIAIKLSDDPVSFSFHRVPRGGIELEQYEDLVNCLDTIQLAQMKDRWSWSLTCDDEFLVKSVRNLLDDSLLNSNGSPMRWVKEIPIKINIFAWRV